MTDLDRRALLTRGCLAAAAALLPARLGLAQGTPPADTAPTLNLRTWSTGEAGAFRNIYALETETGIVVVDAPLRRSDGAAAREWLLSLHKPVTAVLITHMHPDHNFGLTEMLKGMSPSIFASRAVASAIRAAEDRHQSFLPAFIGEAETERDRLFPDVELADAETVEIDGMAFQVRDVGEAESAADSIWTSPGLPNVQISGDLVLHRVHTWVAQGATGRYLSVLERLQAEVDGNALFMTGHGGMVTAGAIQRQMVYLQTYRDAIRDLAQGRPTLSDREKQELVLRMTALEPSPVLSFGITVGADAVARELSAG